MSIALMLICLHCTWEQVDTIFPHVWKFILFHCGKKYRMIRSLCKICGFITRSVLGASKKSIWIKCALFHKLRNNSGYVSGIWYERDTFVCSSLKLLEKY